MYRPVLSFAGVLPLNYVHSFSTVRSGTVATAHSDTLEAPRKAAAIVGSAALLFGLAGPIAARRLHVLSTCKSTLSYVETCYHGSWDHRIVLYTSELFPTCIFGYWPSRLWPLL